MIDFKQEINKYKSIRTTDDVSGDITNEIQDILDLLKQVSSRPVVVKSTGAAPPKPTSASSAPRTVATKPIASIVPKATPVHTSADTTDANEESTNTVD